MKDGRSKNLLLATKIQIETGSRDSSGLGDLIHRHSLVAVLEENPERSRKYMLSLFIIAGLLFDILKSNRRYRHVDSICQSYKRSEYDD
jgi:hypothetical protein